MHRWLADDREESYSDWLAWVIEQIKMPELVFRVFGVFDVQCPPRMLARSIAPTV